jgi:purine-binding chemotaxis protein CheW
VSGWVTFEMAGREMAGSLDEVREVVRATGIEELSGTRAPVTGLLELRGTPVPVVDLRTAADPDGRGDVLVLTTAEGLLGLAVDKVLAVVGQDDLLPLPPGAPRSVGLPPYVLEVRHDPSGRPVLVVSLRALAGLVPA